VDGALYYFLLPLPLGASIGVRGQVRDSDQLAVALAGRFGHVGLGSSKEDANGNDVSTNATYGDVSVAGQLNPRGTLRPGLAVSLLPAYVRNSATNSAAENFSATAVSATLSLTIAAGGLEIAPFANFVHFTSDNLGGGRSVVTGGFSLAARPQHARRPSLPPSAPPGAPPGF
jgi:hypothetical protein